MSARILVVDDDRPTCRMIEMRLLSEGHEVVVVESARAALERMNQFEPHVVVTDINMAETSGIELCAELGGAWPDVPVIVITAVGDGARDAVQPRQVFDFLHKPFELDEGESRSIVDGHVQVSS